MTTTAPSDASAVTVPRRRRIFASTLVILALTLAILLLANIPGEVESRFEWVAPRTTAPFPEYTPYFDRNNTYVHGWPWIYARREFDPLGPHCWQLEEIDSVQAAPLLGNIAVGLLILVAVALGYQAWRRRRASWWQFHLADLFILMLLVAGGLAWYVSHRRLQTLERSLLAADSGLLHHRRAWVGDELPEVALGGPAWLRQLCARDSLLHGPSALAFPTDHLFYLAIDVEDLPHIVRLSRLKSLYVDLAGVDADLSPLDDMPLESLFINSYDENLKTKSRLRSLPRLPKLRSFELFGTNQIDDDQLLQFPELEQLIWQPSDPELDSLAQFVKLRELYILNSQSPPAPIPDLSPLTSLEVLCVWKATDADLSRIGQIPSLRSLILNKLRVTGDGLKKLSNLRQLESLTLSSEELGDAQLAFLPQFPNLRQLVLRTPTMTTATFAAIQQQKSLQELELDDAWAERHATDVKRLRDTLPNLIPSPPVGSGGGMF